MKPQPRAPIAVALPPLSTHAAGAARSNDRAVHDVSVRSRARGASRTAGRHARCAQDASVSTAAELAPAQDAQRASVGAQAEPSALLHREGAAATH
jgi:hypothetical protein